MIDLRRIRELEEPKILVLGDHPGLVQAILDFDFLVGKKRPSVVGVVGTQKRFLRYFWGKALINIPGFVTLDEVDNNIKNKVSFFSTVQSGRRAVAISEEALIKLPRVQGGMIFAEGVPEKHAIHLRKVVNGLDKFVMGPASVGLAVGGFCKLGAIAGTLPEQIAKSGILVSGKVAVISTSGGMVNELINLVSANGSGVSFAAAVGGERYPITTPAELVGQALADQQTKAIVYFGEVGGNDEYQIAEVLSASRRSKPFIGYIAGTIAEKLESAPQFGHAKSMAQNQAETASAKKAALRRSGATIPDSFAAFETALKKLPKVAQSAETVAQTNQRLELMRQRSAPLFVNRISSDIGGEVRILDKPLLDYIDNRGLSEIALGMFLGRQPRSAKLADFFDTSLRLLVDHGPQVSGAVNTMITARAGKDLAASLASGILTIGPRFGGAINEAARNWFAAVSAREDPKAYVERFSRNKRYIPGIGHRKYSLENPDPRAALLVSSFDINGPHMTFAKEVAAITTSKKAQLILNVDGTIAALLLDLLLQDEKYTPAEINALINTDFCNAIFIYARTVGLIAHHLEQQRLDEGLFRMPAGFIDSI